MGSCFISRSLAADSPLRSWCNREGIVLVDQSLLQFQAVSFGPLPERVDWIFFYSPRAAAFFWEAEPLVSVNTRLAAIGPGTAASLAELGKKVDFTGSGDPAATAAAFSEVAAGQRVLFPRARQSRRSVERLLRERIEALDLVVYNNELSPQRFTVDFSTLIFTSPMNVEAYCKVNRIKAESRIIALGPATAGALIERGFFTEQAAAPTEAALLALLASR